MAHRSPKEPSPRPSPCVPGEGVIILGAGVAGLTCGVVLAERGVRVRIVAAKSWRATASGKAGGLWLPYRIEPRDRVLAWSKLTFDILTDLSADGSTGVLMRDQVELYRDITPAEHIWWLSAVPDHRRLGACELPAGYRDGYAARVPVMDVPFYMPYLERRFAAAGGMVEITGRATESIDSLFGESKLIINCTGLGARQLCNDTELYPIRGQLLRTTNPGIDRCTADELHPLGIAYVTARSQDCILGGTADAHVFDETIDPASRQRLLDVNLQLDARLADAKILEDVVCLRPFRTSVRLERELCPGGSIIHNYGHGGAGYTVSWGCALEVARLVSGSNSK